MRSVAVMCAPPGSARRATVMILAGLAYAIALGFGGH